MIKFILCMAIWHAMEAILAAAFFSYDIRTEPTRPTRLLQFVFSASFVIWAASLITEAK